MMNELIRNIGMIRTTELGTGRIRKNLDLQTDDIIDWCKAEIGRADRIERRGKNWYVYTGKEVFTINAHSYTIITAKRTD